MDDFNGVGLEEDPAAAFLAQQESEIAGIESEEGLGVNLADGVEGAVNGEPQRVSNGPSDAYSTLAQVEPESLRRWREEQREQLEVLDARSRSQEAEWKDRAKQELEEWYCRQDEQLDKTKANNRVLDEDFYKQPLSDIIGYVTAEEAVAVDAGDDSDPGTEWQRVARLCDFSPKSSKQAKDVSRMRSVLISLKQTPLVH